MATGGGPPVVRLAQTTLAPSFFTRSACAAASGRTLNVVVECDTGRKRAGVETPEEAIALAREIAG